VKRLIDDVRARGVEDFRVFTDVHEEFVPRCMSEIRVLDVNSRTLELFGAADKETLLHNLPAVFRDEMEPHFREQLIDLWDGKLFQQREVVNYALDGTKLHLLLQFSVLPNHERDWSLVQVALTDITARKKAEAYLEYLGTHDVLTRTLNRSFYVDELNRLERKGPKPVTIIIADLNGLKTATTNSATASATRCCAGPAKWLVFDLGTRKDRPGVLQQGMHQRKFARGECTDLLAERKRALVEIEADGVVTEPRYGIPRLAPQHGANSCQQFAHFEGLEQIVVRTNIQAFDSRVEVVARGQDQDRHGIAAGSCRAQQLDSRQPGQAQIEQHHGIFGRVHRRAPGDTVAHPVDAIVRVLECAHQALPDLQIVFNQKDSHTSLPCR
jgi:hypothetical protein